MKPTILDPSGRPVSRETMPEASQLDGEPPPEKTTAHGLPDDERGQRIEAAFAKVQKHQPIRGSSVAAITKAAYRAFHAGQISGIELQLLGGKPPMKKQLRA